MKKRMGIVLVLLLAVVALLTAPHLWRESDREDVGSNNGLGKPRVTALYVGSIRSDGNYTVILPICDLDGYSNSEVLKLFRFNLKQAEEVETLKSVDVIDVSQEGYIQNATEMNLKDYKALKIVGRGDSISIIGGIDFTYSPGTNAQISSQSGSRGFSCSSSNLTLKERSDRNFYWFFVQPQDNATYVFLSIFVTYWTAESNWTLVFLKEISPADSGWVRISPYKFANFNLLNPQASLFYTLDIYAEGDYTIYAPVPLEKNLTDEALLTHLYTGGGISFVDIIEINSSVEGNLTFNRNVSDVFKAFVVRGSGVGVLNIVYPINPSQSCPSLSLQSKSYGRYWIYFEGKGNLTVRLTSGEYEYLILSYLLNPEQLLTPGWNIIDVHFVDYMEFLYWIMHRHAP